MAGLQERKKRAYGDNGLPPPKILFLPSPSFIPWPRLRPCRLSGWPRVRKGGRKEEENETWPGERNSGTCQPPGSLESVSFSPTPPFPFFPSVARPQAKEREAT